MATDFQSVDITAKPFPFQQQASFNASRYSTVPWGQAIVNESFQTTTVGAGDDGLINIDIGLPADYVAMLRSLHLQVIDTAQVRWDEGTIGLAYQEPGGPYKNSVTEYPEDEYTWFQMIRDDVTVKDRFGTLRYYGLFNLGGSGTPGTAGAFTDGWSPTQIPLWIPPSADANFLDRSVVIFIRNPYESQPAQELTLRMSFDLFTFEQAYSAAVMSSPRVFS